MTRNGVLIVAQYDRLTVTVNKSPVNRRAGSSRRSPECPTAARTSGSLKPPHPTARGIWASTSFAIGLGCDPAHAHKLVYSTGLALDDPGTAVPIGAGCKICNRSACAQRAFPYLGERVAVNENSGSGLPYSPATQLA